MLPTKVTFHSTISDSTSCIAKPPPKAEFSEKTVSFISNAPALKSAPPLSSGKMAGIRHSRLRMKYGGAAPFHVSEDDTHNGVRWEKTRWASCCSAWLSLDHYS